MRFIRWLQGWSTTIDIYLHNRELYRILKDPMNDIEFIEVNRPE